MYNLLYLVDREGSRGCRLEASKASRFKESGNCGFDLIGGITVVEECEEEVEICCRFVPKGKDDIVDLVFVVRARVGNRFGESYRLSGRGICC